MSILDTIAGATRKRVTQAKERLPLEKLQKKAFEAPDSPDFEAALSLPGLAFICEIKKASPSKGIISRDFPYLQIAQAYEAGGADAISCLTEPQWFMGSDDIFREVRAHTSLPMLRKDFTIDAYQIWEARAMGASAILLICALLDIRTLRDYMALATDLHMSCLVETHDEAEIERAQSAGAHIIGVNNRNLKDFSVHFENAARLRSLIDADRLYVAESGVSSIEDVHSLSSIGADAVLVGEFLMRSPDPAALLERMRSDAN